MAEIAKSGIPSVATVLPDAANKLTGLLAGEALGAGDACYINATDGRVYRSNGTAANAAAKVHGWAAMAAAINDGITLFNDVNIRYGAGLVPGTLYFVSGTVPGGIADVSTIGGSASVAFAVDATRIHAMLSRY